MFKFINSIIMFQQLDPKIYELQKANQLYKIAAMVSVLIIVVLLLIIILQRIALKKARGTGSGAASGVKKKGAGVGARSLPDPGLIFKYSVTGADVSGKTITIGQTEGSIKTFSTEIINDHFIINIRKMDNSKGDYITGDIHDEYMIDLKREGKALICMPDSDTFRQMGPVERIYLMKEDDPAGDPTFDTIDPAQPVRFRLGANLNDDEKFANGYFEFHLFTQEFRANTDSDDPRYQKNFMVRLYRIYPGYDVSSPDKNGLFPMIEPYGQM